jgi:hypothetical protein
MNKLIVLCASTFALQGCALITGGARETTGTAATPRGFADRALRVHIVAAKGEVAVANVRDVFRPPRFLTTVGTDYVDDSDAEAPLCSLAHEIDADLVVRVKSFTESRYSGGGPRCVRSRLAWVETPRSNHVLPNLGRDLQSVCEEYESEERSLTRRALPDRDRLSVTFAPRDCAMEGQVAAAELTNEAAYVIKELHDLFPSWQGTVVREGQRGATVAVDAEHTMSVGQGAKAIREDGTTRMGIVTAVEGRRAEVTFMSSREPGPLPQTVETHKRLWAVGLYPEARVLVGQAVGYGLNIEAFPMHHGALFGISGGGFEVTRDAGAGGGSGLHGYAGYAYWLFPTRLALYGRADFGLSSFRRAEEDEANGKAVVHAGTALGAKFRIPKVAFIDASGGYDAGPTVHVGALEDGQRSIPFAWRGASLRLTAGFTIDAWPGR